MNEFQLHQLVADWCRAIKLDQSCLWWHTPNGGKRGGAEAMKLKLMGVKAGVPDLTFVWKSTAGTHVGMIELKAARGTLSEPQKIFRDQCASQGVKWRECRSLEHVAETLVEWGVAPATVLNTMKAADGLWSFRQSTGVRK